ncbi:MAG: iron ABC transporter permease, partial [Phycisphaerales bacterium]
MKFWPARQLNRWPLLVGLAVLIVLVAYPVALLIVQSIFPEALAGDFSGPFGAYLRILTTDGVPEMLWNSVRWAGATTALAWLLGVPCGYVLARTNLRGKAIARLMFLVPIMTPPYVFALSYTLLMLPGGFGDSMLGGVPEWLRSLFFSFWGVTFVMAISSFGYITLAVEATLRATPTRLEHAAAMLGASRFEQFRFILLPLLRPALLNAGLLVFLDAISNFGVPAIMGPRANLPLLPAEIYALVTSWPVDFPLATALSSLLLFVAILTLLINQRLLRRSQQSSGRTTQALEHTLSPMGHVLIWTGLVFIFLLTVLLPYLAMLLSSVVDRWAAGTPELTWRHYRELLTPGSRGLGALWTSLWLSLSAATICAGLGGFIAYTIARFRGRLATLLDVTAILPRVLPKIVMAIALIMAWNAPWIGGLRLYNTVWMLLVAYIALYLSD